MNITEGELVLEAVEIVARDTKRFRFTRPEDFEFVAGQFVSMEFGKKAWRAYSIASSPEENFLEFIVRILPGGLASGVFDAAKPGETFFFRGPFGQFVRSERKNTELVFCATGTGIAPIRSMILAERAEKNPRPMTLLYGGREPGDLAYLEELTAMENVNVQLGFSRTKNFDDWKKWGRNCRITQFLEESEWTKNAEFYVCGNGDMVTQTVQLLKKRCPHNAVFHERFS